MRIYDVIQGTDEWKKLRQGVITGTRLKALSSAPSTQTFKTLLDELVAEDFAPPADVFQNDAMIRGNMLEPMNNYIELLKQECSQESMDEDEREVKLKLCKQTIKDAIQMCVTNHEVCHLEARVIREVFDLIDNIK